MSASPISVLVVGASGTLGSNLARGLLNDKFKTQLSVSILVRSESAKKDGIVALVAAGAKIVNGDATQESASLAAVIKEAGIQVVVSALPAQLLLDGQLNLLAAAKASGTVNWFIPSDFGFDTALIGAGSAVPIFESKIAVQKALKESGLAHSEFISGLFTEYALSPFAGLDVAAGTITAPGSFDAKFTTTTLGDIGLLLADAIATGRGRNQKVYFGSSTVTYEQFAQIVERATGKTLKRVVRPLADIDAAYTKDGNDWQARFAAVFGKQVGTSWSIDQSYSTKNRIAVTTLEQYAQKTLKQ